MKICILLISLFFSFFQSAFCQNEPDFKNQGEYELYKAKKFFEKHYKEQNHEIFKGKIKKNGNTFEFGSKGFGFTLNHSKTELELVLEQGLLYPRIIFGEWVEDPDQFQDIMESRIPLISNFEELKSLTHTPKVKRFWFWIFHSEHMNPDVYLIELTNPSANESTSLENFIKGAKLTFIKYGWTNI